MWTFWTRNVDSRRGNLREGRLNSPGKHATTPLAHQMQHPPSMTYIMMTIGGIWAVASLTFCVALGLAAKRSMPAPDRHEQMISTPEIQYSNAPTRGESWFEAHKVPSLGAAELRSAA